MSGRRKRRRERQTSVVVVVNRPQSAGPSVFWKRIYDNFSYVVFFAVVVVLIRFFIIFVGGEIVRM